jgi:hypothetical protein
MRKRAISDIDTALRLYYEKDELDNKDISLLFGGIVPSTVSSMKKEVLAKMAEENITRFRYHTVNTEVAYRVWGIDVEKLEKRRAKLIKLGLMQINT